MSRARSGTHQIQWWDQLMGETRSAVAAVRRTPRGSLVVRRLASHRPAAATRAAGTAQRGPGCGSWAARATSPCSDWLSTIHALPTRPVSKIRCVQKSTLAAGSVSAPSTTVPVRAAVAVSPSRTRRVRKRYAMKIAGVSLIPAAIPIAKPLPTAPGGLVRSQRMRQARARLICPKRSVWKTGSNQSAAAVPARRAAGRVGVPTRRQERWTRSPRRATLPTTKASLRAGRGSQVVGTKRMAAKGGYVAGSSHSVTVNP